MLNGWQTRTAQELDQTIRTWGEMMNHYQIPITAYPDLYRRAFDVRQSKIQKGDEAPQMDATLLISQWTGAFGLQNELRQREIDQGRTLTPNAESVCRHCLGSGWRKIDPDDRLSPVKRCDHQD